jgi:hypothetical protein
MTYTLTSERFTAFEPTDSDDAERAGRCDHDYYQVCLLGGSLQAYYDTSDINDSLSGEQLVGRLPQRALASDPRCRNHRRTTILS